MNTRYDFGDEPHWSDEGADYDGTECKNCSRQRVLLYKEAQRRVCEKCNWDQDRGADQYPQTRRRPVLNTGPADTLTEDELDDQLAELVALGYLEVGVDEEGRVVFGATTKTEQEKAT